MRLRLSSQNFNYRYSRWNRVLDGEIIVTDPAGKPDFEGMMSRFQSKSNNIEYDTLSYVVFDVIKYMGKSVTMLPLMDRKQLLNEIITQDTSLVAKVKYIEGHGSAYFDLVRQQGLEESGADEIMAIAQVYDHQARLRSHEILADITKGE
ncbi:hypothetical protein CVD27_10990 [Neobacillus cucumis]|uniref:ATP-dependent DNA ligase family profile domain-containing protein n=1 Tax=Neobacillus cucumis TaxID=1740721 RepID=A0A2N5HGY2_9BACI|nr:hypothetical protein CVD27_10990 [Neobacillus cucumis]